MSILIPDSQTKITLEEAIRRYQLNKVSVLYVFEEESDTIPYAACGVSRSTRAHWDANEIPYPFRHSPSFQPHFQYYAIGD